VALAEVKQKKTFGFGKHNVGREYKIPYTAVPVCFSPNLQHFLLFQNWAVLERLPVMTLVMVVLCHAQMGTRMKPAD